jgi:signal peptidase II
MAHSQLLNCPAIDVAGLIGLVHVENPGTGTHWFRTNGEAAALGLLSLLVIAIYAIWMVRAPLVGAIATGMQLGGTVGNLLDHLLRASATDMFRINGHIVNLADALIVVGGLLAVLTLAWVLLRPSAAPAVRVLDST